jgi:hypothetical protein
MITIGQRSSPKLIPTLGIVGTLLLARECLGEPLLVATMDAMWPVRV